MEPSTKPVVNGTPHPQSMEAPIEPVLPAAQGPTLQAASMQPEGDTSAQNAQSINNVPSAETMRQDLMNQLRMANQDDSTDTETEQRMRYNRRANLIPPLATRKGKSEKRLAQTAAFLRLAEDRMAFMEQEIADLKSSLGKAPTRPKSSNASETEDVNEGSVDESDREEDSREDDPYELPDKPYKKIDERDWRAFQRPPADKACVIELLNGEVGVGKHRLAIEPARRSLKKQQNDLSEESGVIVPVVETQAKIPHRVKIHSEGIMKVLEKITSYRWGSDRDCTFLAPFKTFVRHEQELRQELKLMEKLFPDKLVDPEPVTTTQSTTGESDEVTPETPDDPQESARTSVGTSRKPPQSRKPKPKVPVEQKAFSKDEFRSGRLALAHLRLLLKFIEDRLQGLLLVRDQLDDGTLRNIAFSNLFLLFNPSDVVYSQDRKQAYEIFSVSGGLPIDKEKAAEYRSGTHGAGLYAYNQHDFATPFIIDCYHFDFDGGFYGPVQKSFAIPYFHGEKPIASLPVFPERCLEKGSTVKGELIRYGKTFVDLVQDGKTFAHKTYEGLVRNVKEDTEEIHSQIIIDFCAAFRKHPEWEPDLGLKGSTERDPREMTDCTGVNHFYDENDNDPICIMCENEHFWPDEQLIHERCAEHLAFIADDIQRTRDFRDLKEDIVLLLPSTLFGFALRSRKWAAFDIREVQDLVHPEEGFDELVIDPKHKTIVRALVETHPRGANPAGGKPIEDLNSKAAADYQADLVRGKGRGRILLLHGPPGVGKTSTAECVADLTGRPLFQITCGDIGTEPEDVERNLDENFLLAHRWGCVLLLDEADVFLQERDRSNLKRNSLVSVFLRVLEYYPGILFLTTNREGIFDEAFKSRIHIILRYEKPSREDWLLIWQNNIRRAQKHYNIDKEKLVQWAARRFEKLDWNGRQIRNAFQAAIALAEFAVRSSASPIQGDIFVSDTKPTKIEIGKKHFQDVADVSLEFDEYITSIYGMGTFSDRARTDSLRNDSFRSSRAMGNRNNNFSNATVHQDPMRSPLAHKSIGRNQSYGQQGDREGPQNALGGRNNYNNGYNLGNTDSEDDD